MQVEAPNIEVRDDNKTAQTDKVYIDAGVKSVQTTRQELGLDDESLGVDAGRIAGRERESRPADAEEIEQRIQGYRDELAARP